MGVFSTSKCFQSGLEGILHLKIIARMTMARPGILKSSKLFSDRTFSLEMRWSCTIDNLTRYMICWVTSEVYITLSYWPSFTILDPLLTKESWWENWFGLYITLKRQNHYLNLKALWRNINLMLGKLKTKI
jgi:hypothetical protein